MGRLLTESLGDAAERTYEYDVRSRPVAITAYNYRQKLGFTYGGNVSRMTWWAYGPNETERSYTYSYDALSRLTEARYTDGEGGTGRYDVTYSYDLNGNVTALQRSGLYDNGSLKKYGLIDNLTLEYEGNMLRRVTDGCGAAPFYQGAYHFVDGADETQEYTYDGNGNTTMDLNRRVTAVGYDTNNRPRLIEFDGGSSTAYLYDAAGLKRLTVHRVATERPSVPGAEPQEPELSMTRTDYCGDIIYEDSLLSRINFDGGYLSFTNNAGERLDRPAYHFYHRDHLGNNRMDLGENGSVWQICHYYPYGMLMGCSYLGESQRWKFGGKELDRVSGLDLLDFEARPYDATLGRFWRPDDLASQYHPLSPFLYCAANPLRLIDPTGTIIIASQLQSQQTILNTLPQKEQSNISFDKNGYLNVDNKIDSNSSNYKTLKAMAESPLIANVLSQDSFEYSDNNGNIHSHNMGEIDYDEVFYEENPINPTGPTTGEDGFFGKTLLPGNGESGHNSVNDEIFIIINSGLSEQGAAQSFSHEGYGHAYIYMITQDRKASAHDYQPGGRDNNRVLIKQICNSVSETTNNYKESR